MKNKEGATEASILSSAERVFYNRGYDGARMQEIADEACINKALLHYYFRSKEKLFDAVFFSAVSRLVPPLFARFAADKPLSMKVVDFVDAWFATVEGNPFLPGFVIHELHRNPGRFREILSEQPLIMLDRLAVQMGEELEGDPAGGVAAEQFILNLLSLCAFPFIASSAMQVVSAKDEKQYRLMLKERKRLIPIWMAQMFPQKKY